MQEAEDLLDHINKVKALTDQLACLEVPVRDEDVAMTLLESLPPSYEYLMTALESLPMQDLTMEFVTARLMHEVCLDALHMPWCRMRRGVSFMQRAQNACFLGIVKAPRHTG